MDYVVLGSIALFILVARNSERLPAIMCAVLIAGGPFVLSIITTWIAYGYDDMIARVFNIHSVISLVLQLGVLWGMFYKIKQNENDLTTYFGWVAVGWPLVFLFLPWLVRTVF